MCSVLAGLTALSGYMQYQSQQEQADAQAKAYEAQARADEQNARIENRRMEQDADNYAQKSRELQQRRRITEGQQRAQAGAAGIGMAGSPLDILSSGYDAYTQDQMTLLSNQRNDNYNRRLNETNFLTQAAGHRAAADNVRSVAKTQGMMTILGTAASIYGMGGFGGGGGSTAGSVAKSTTAPVGTNTTSSWTLQNGYNFMPTNTPLTGWGSSRSLNLGNFGQQNYFGYIRGK